MQTQSALYGTSLTKHFKVCANCKYSRQLVHIYDTIWQDKHSEESLAVLSHDGKRVSVYLYAEMPVDELVDMLSQQRLLACTHRSWHHECKTCSPQVTRAPELRYTLPASIATFLRTPGDPRYVEIRRIAFRGGLHDSLDYCPDWHG